MTASPVDIEARRGHTRRTLTAATYLLIGALLPFFIALSFIRTFGVNLPMHDEWNFMPAVESFYEGHDWPSKVLEHYGEHRIPVPKAIILGLAPFTKLNVKIEMYFSATLMFAAVLLCWRLIVETSTARWLIIPIGWLLLSIGQVENLIVGWQFQIPLMNFFALLAILLLSRPRPPLWHHLVAAACAVAATFSFANGMLIWPAAILLVVERRRSIRHAAVWSGLMVVAVYLYRLGYQGFQRMPGDATPNYFAAVTGSPPGAFKLFLGIVGNNFGAGGIETYLISGAILLIIGLLVAVYYLFLSESPLWPGRRAQSEDGGSPTDSSIAFLPSPWVALMTFSLLSALAIAVGRAPWHHFITPTRYSTVTIFIPISLLVLGSEWLRRLPRRSVARIAAVCGAIVLVSLGAWQHAKRMRNGWILAQATYFQNIEVTRCLLDYQNAPDDCLRRIYAPDPGRVRQYAAMLERWRLGPFQHIPPKANRRIPPQGSLDIVTFVSNGNGTATVTAYGWTIVDSATPPKSVTLLLDGQQIGSTSTFFNRPDVAAHFGVPLPPTGWKIQAPAGLLQKGRHRVEIVLPSGLCEQVSIASRDVTF